VSRWEDNRGCVGVGVSVGGWGVRLHMNEAGTSTHIKKQKQKICGGTQLELCDYADILFSKLSP
jgi:hypothetical protein